MTTYAEPSVDGLLQRPRLVDQVVRSPGAVLIEAGGGFGKSVLVDQATNAAQSAGWVARLPIRHVVGLDEVKAMKVGDVPFGELVQAPGPGLLVVDNVQSLDDEAASWMADTVQGGGSPRVVLSGRRLPSPLAALELVGAAVRFDADDLRLTPEETTALVRMEIGDEDAERLGSVLHHFSGGWVSLLLLVTRRLRRAEDRVGSAAEILRHRAVVGQLVDYYLSELTSVDRDLFVQLSHFPMVNQNVVGALGSSDLLRRLSDAGIPFSIGGDGWWRLPSPVQDHLVAQASLDPEIAARAAPLFVAQGAELEAAELLADGGNHEAAAKLLALLPTDRIDALSAGGFVRLAARLGDAIEVAPRALLHLARVQGNVGNLREERAIIERAREVARTAQDADMAVEVEAEYLFQLAMLNQAGVTDEIERLLLTVGEGTRSRARLLEALSVGLSELPDEPSLRRAEDAMRRASLIWRDLGEPSRAASVQRGLAQRVLWAMGRFGEAASLLESLRAASETHYDRMLCLVFEARQRSLAGQGEGAEAALVEAVRLAEFLRIDWVEGYAAWTRLMIAANEGDAARVVEQLAVAETSLGQLTYDAAGLLFFCEAADACAVVDAHEPMERLLAAARERQHEDPPLFALTEACIGARQGRPEAAAALRTMVEAGAVAPGMRWKVELLQAAAALAGGDVAGAGRLLQEALDCAGRLAQPDLPERREQRIVEALRSAVANRTTTGAEIDETDRYEIAVLDGFAVRRNDDVLAAPPGRPTELVKRVVVAGGSVSVDMVVEDMWPDVPPGLGHRRLKNVLARARTAFGPLIERSGPVLELAPCRVDLAQFEHQATDVAASRGDERVARARRALALYTGPLLPGDRYDDAIDRRREAVRRRALGLVDVVLAAELAAGDLDGATDVLEMALLHDPVDQQRPLRVARAHVRVGRDLEARSLAARVAALASEHDVPLAVEWHEILVLT
jgi:DNA-binding SARP family transcriptional activator